MDHLLVFADIETDGLGADKILQIGAVTDQGQEFNVYINPKRDLPLSCTNLCGLYYFKNQLYRDGIRLPSVGVITAIRMFKTWVESLGKPVTMVFHNGFAFDCHVLAKYFIKFKVVPPTNITKMCDTLPVFRKHLVDTELANHRLTTLAAYFEIDFIYAHDALQDSIILKSVCYKAALKIDRPLEELLNEHQKSVEYFIEKEHSRNELKLRPVQTAVSLSVLKE